MISEENIKYSSRNLLQKPGRSLLTILSMFIGITTIFVFISFGLGLYGYVNTLTSSSSADKITIMQKGVSAPGIDETFALTKSDLRAIETTSGVYEASSHYIKVCEAIKNRAKRYVFVIGYEPAKPMVFQISNIGLYKGRWLAEGDTNKVLLGYNYQIDNKIFLKALDLNDKLDIQGVEYRVAGFLDEIGTPPDDAQIYMTNDALLELFNNSLKGYSWIIAKVDLANIDRIIGQVEKNVRDSRGLEKGKEDFFVQSWQDLLETYSGILDGLIIFIILIAFISVLVSTINTANTMITSVLERVREIGIMKAIGAKNSEIFKIFLFESALLGLAAGILGVGLGWIISYSLGELLENIGWGFLSPYYSWSLFIALITFATFTGALSGAIPAYRASKIKPVEALRYQ